ncbi:MAG: F0F1 ATP synthase subunit B' [Rhodospirillales bacterium]|nr:MAG: F0F1 ATP synthase subunit B' [Rhodospirillales bacterium]
MPQLNVAMFPTQLFWLAVCFVALYLLVTYVIVPRVGTVLDERQRRIDDNLERAATLKAEAEAAIATYEQALADARTKAQNHLREKMGQMQAEAESRTRALGEKLAADIKAGEARVLAAREAAIQGVRALAGDVAGDIAARLTGGAVDKSGAQAAVDSVMGSR